MIKIKIGSRLHDIEIQEFDGKVIIHCGEIHIADVELYKCLEKLRIRIIESLKISLLVQE